MKTVSFNQALAAAREQSDYIEDGTFAKDCVCGADASKIECKNSTFKDCTFTDCRFAWASFYECTFEDCVFSGCVFTDAFFRNAKLSRCQCDGCNFSSSHMRDSILFHSGFRYATFYKGVWNRVTLDNSNFKEAALTEMRLTKPVFKKTDFTGADFFKTPLKGLDLCDCVIDGIAVSDSCAELRGAKITAEQAPTVARLIGVRIV